MDTVCVGMKYRIQELKNQGIEFPWARLYQHPLVRLEHEPQNPFDPNAIKVMLPFNEDPPFNTDIHLGYIPAKVAAALIAKFGGDNLPAAIVTEVGADSIPERRGIRLFLDLEGVNS